MSLLSRFVDSIKVKEASTFQAERAADGYIILTLWGFQFRIGPGDFSKTLALGVPVPVEFIGQRPTDRASSA